MRRVLQKPTLLSKPVSLDGHSKLPFRPAPLLHSTLHLQRTAGNQAVLRKRHSTEDGQNQNSSDRSSVCTLGGLEVTHAAAEHAIERGAIRASVITEVGERANWVLDRKHDPAHLQAARTDSAQKSSDATPPPIVDEVINSSGQPLDSSTRSEMEARFAHGFSRVRVHSGARAAESAAAVRALAYTIGEDVVFGAGLYQPQTTAGTKLIAHELTHVVQQSNGLRTTLAISDPEDADEREAERTASAIDQDSSPVYSNTGAQSKLMRQVQDKLRPEGGGAPYLPSTDLLRGDMNIKTAAERRAFLAAFTSDVFTAWKTVKLLGYWEKLKAINAMAQDESVTSRLDPVPASASLIDTKHNKVVKTRYPNPAVRFSIGPDSAAGEELLEEQLNREPGATTEESNDGDVPIDALTRYAKDSQQTTLAIMSLRRIQTVVNRFYAAYLASMDVDVDYSLAEILAIYQQEGNKEMPASAASLSQDIPTGVSDSVTLVGTKSGGKIDISNGVLTLNPNFRRGTMRIKEMTDEAVRLYALGLYANHIGGLDVIWYHSTIPQLAKWSADGRSAVNKVQKRPDDPEAYTKALRKWADMRDNLQITKSVKAYVIAPADPVTFVRDILVEAMIQLRQYSDPERLMGETNAASAIGPNLPLSLSYMQFNSSKIANKDRVKVLVVSAIKAARAYEGADRFKIVREEAQLIGNPSSFEEIKKWLMRQAPYDDKSPSRDTAATPATAAGASSDNTSAADGRRWRLVVDFMEHAGYEDWKNNWPTVRGNASLVRTQAEFYRIAFEE